MLGASKPIIYSWVYGVSRQVRMTDVLLSAHAGTQYDDTFHTN